MPQVEKGLIHRLLQCHENCALCKYEWKARPLNDSRFWYAYGLLTFLVLAVYTRDFVFAPSGTILIEGNQVLSQDQLVRQLHLHTNTDLSTVERIDIWSDYVPRSQERLAKDPCVGYSATLSSCLREFEHTESRRLPHNDLLFMSEYNYTRERPSTCKGITDLLDSLAIGAESRGERTFYLSELYQAAASLQYCQRKADISTGLCEEQIAAARLYSVLHKGYGVQDADRVTLKKLLLQGEHDTKELTFLLHAK